MSQVTDFRAYETARNQAARLGIPRTTAVRMVADERRAGRTGQHVAGQLRLQAMGGARPTTPPGGA
ncbi:hypothetical protein [Pseudoxanthomonas indica]|uniref:Uncharacterized protein n=1 Tax=Pseudoxanthomonas indica TaxID=428993 RepID=A0A1T5JDP9_9GAMM|nr:hypothetical protein [Pseudoxanthomonas indica]GGD58055.1 hypothetical protein GCM10007235_32930 [Pseudoxanthomonas indica]SKC49474.1 hypothetical protein SAMN06296058_0716 [Pseudoxanthomonas indica]